MDSHAIMDAPLSKSLSPTPGKNQAAVAVSKCDVSRITSGARCGTTHGRSSTMTKSCLVENEKCKSKENDNDVQEKEKSNENVENCESTEDKDMDNHVGNDDNDDGCTDMDVNKDNDYVKKWCEYLLKKSTDDNDDDDDDDEEYCDDDDDDDDDDEDFFDDNDDDDENPEYLDPTYIYEDSDDEDYEDYEGEEDFEDEDFYDEDCDDEDNKIDDDDDDDCKEDGGQVNELAGTYCNVYHNDKLPKNTSVDGDGDDDDDCNQDDNDDDNTEDNNGVLLLHKDMLMVGTGTKRGDAKHTAQTGNTKTPCNSFTDKDVFALKELCAKYGLSTKGTREKLVSRLQDMHNTPCADTPQKEQGATMQQSSTSDQRTIKLSSLKLKK